MSRHYREQRSGLADRLDLITTFISISIVVTLYFHSTISSISTSNVCPASEAQRGFLPLCERTWCSEKTRLKGARACVFIAKTFQRFILLCEDGAEQQRRALIQHTSALSCRRNRIFFFHELDLGLKEASPLLLRHGLVRLFCSLVAMSFSSLD